MPSSFEIHQGKKGKALLKSNPVSVILFCLQWHWRSRAGNLDFNRAFARLKLFDYSKPKKNLRWLLIIQQ
jgi:hypothetical protein